MTEKSLLKRIILKAQENGYKLNINYFNRSVNLSDDNLYARLFIFSHDFAKAFWGEEIGYKKVDFLYYRHKIGCFEKMTVNTFLQVHTQVQLNLLLDGKTHNFYNIDYMGEITYYKKSEGWQYHLQQMVLEKEPLKYLEKFL